MSPVRRWRWSLAVPLVALAALFGMHGLGDHSGAHAFTPGHSAHGAPATTSHHLTEAVAGAVGSGSGTVWGVEHAGPAFLCLAVLLGGAMALALLARAARRTPWLTPRLSRSPRAVSAGRDRDPPTLLALCVCRC